MRRSAWGSAAWSVPFVFASVMLLSLTASAGAPKPPFQVANTDRGEQADSLRSLIDEALLRSPLITAARAHWQAETRMPVEESTLPDPQISVQSFSVGNPIPGHNLQTNNFAYFGYGFSQDIPFPGKLRLKASVAEKEAESARAAYEAQQRAVVEHVQEDYFNLFYLMKTFGLLRQTSEELQRVEHITEAHYQVGMGQQQDVLKAQLEATGILKEIQTAREQMEQGQADLKAILGREQDSRDILIAGVAPSSFSVENAQLRQLALAGSPEFKQAQALEAKSVESVRLAREDYIPDFSIAYMYQKTGARFPDYYMATVGVKIPLYFWRKQTPAVEQAALERQSAQAQTYASRLSVLSRVQNQWIAIETSQRVMRIYCDGLIPQADATLNSALAVYRVGKVDFQTLLSAEIDVLRLKQQYYRTVADHEIAIAKIRQVIGNAP